MSEESSVEGFEVNYIEIFLFDLLGYGKTMLKFE